MAIHKGTYNLAKRNLSFDVVDDLDFTQKNSCFYFRGGNGFGKTSFLEKIIIPAFKADHIQYIYIGQDIRTQLYTLRALLSVQGIKVTGIETPDVLRRWVNHNRSASVLILDEFDKYFSDYNFIFDWSESFIRTYLIVTHMGLNHCKAVANKYSIYNLRFDLIDFDGRLKSIRVKKEP